MLCWTQDFKFTKMHACGNDFMVIDGLQFDIKKLTPSLIRRLSDRHFGVGFDQLLVPQHGVGLNAKFNFLFFNADGSSSNQCGNGARCLGLFLLKKNYVQKGECVHIALRNGHLMQLNIQQDSSIDVNMGVPTLKLKDVFVNSQPLEKEGVLSLSIQNLKQTLCVRVVNIGNPHAIVWKNENAWLFEHASKDALFVHIFKQLNGIDSVFKQGVNVSFSEAEKQVCNAVVLERGVGKTLACGSAACAILASSKENNLVVNMPGGILKVNYDEDGNIWLHGDVSHVFEGNYYDIRN